MILLLTLNACAFLTDTAETETSIRPTRHQAKQFSSEGRLAACLLFDPISWSSHDTDQTIIKVKQYNKALELYCKSL
ncbi:hypothetical protein SAMN04515647_3079 [Cohaesibacter sp. ES.047]|nr:hypothetical protein SAMN04515647_3079 [Cohaesibacter sp. ES.047]